MASGGQGHGAVHLGGTFAGSYATNYGRGSIQLIDLSAGQVAYISQDADTAIGLGACTVSNKQSIVVGDGQESHGDGSVTAGGGFYGSGANLTGITPAQIGAVSNTAAGIAAAGGVIGQADLTATFDNTSALSMTATVGRAHCWTLTSTGTASIVIAGWSATTSEQVKVSLICTGSPTIVFPAGCGTFTNGVFSSNAPTMGKYNSGVFMHDAQTYYSLWLNAATPMGTP